MGLRETGHSLALLLARSGLGAIFLFTGYRHILDINGLAERIGAAGFPAAKLQAIVATLAELCGGVSLVLGAITPLGCVALLLFLIPTTYLFHFVPFRRGGADAAMQELQLLKNLGIMGGLVAMRYAGPGRISFDYLLLRRGAKGARA